MQSTVLFFGRSTYDALYRLDRLPEEDTKVFARAFHAAPGGPALNAALTHALLGGRALLVSAIGGGPWGDAVRAEVERRGVEVMDLADRTGYQTPLVSVLINGNGSRTAINPPRTSEALRCLSGDWSLETPAGWGAVPPVVLCDGFHLAECLPLLAACRNAGAAICLDGGSWKPGTEELAPLLTVAICGERFCLPKAESNTGSDPGKIFAWFAERGVACVAITRGDRSILGWERGRRFEIEVERIEATDTLGAGDVLHGAFCHYYASKPEFEPALRRAAALATLSCQGPGAQFWAEAGLTADNLCGARGGDLKKTIMYTL
jgi:sugar/nucleoside kinase (ribokinase family)